MAAGRGRGLPPAKREATTMSHEIPLGAVTENVYGIPKDDRQ